MADPDRLVAGIRCRQVLAELSDYLDGELAAARAAQIAEHLEGCDWCERFGGEFAAIVKAVRERLGAPPPLDEDMRRRLSERLRDS